MLSEQPRTCAVDDSINPSRLPLSRSIQLLVSAR